MNVRALISVISCPTNLWKSSSQKYTGWEIPYGGKLWRVQTLAEWQGKHHWRNKLWRIDDKSLIKRILKQFEYKSTHNWSIHVHVFANAD